MINISKSLTLIGLLLAAVIGLVKGVTLQEPSSLMKRKFDAKIDINPYFLEIFERKGANEQFMCSY